MKDHLQIPEGDALKQVLLALIKKEGIDPGIEIPLRDLAIELLACNSLAFQLYGPQNNSTENTMVEVNIVEKPAGYPDNGNGTVTQIIRRTSGAGSDPNLYGAIQITPWEGFCGVANIHEGFYNRTVLVQAPSSIKQGSTLRLRGMGRQMPDGQKGDLLLKVIIRA